MTSRQLIIGGILLVFFFANPWLVAPSLGAGDPLDEQGKLAQIEIEKKNPAERSSMQDEAAIGELGKGRESMNVRDSEESSPSGFTHSNTSDLSDVTRMGESDERSSVSF